LRRRSNPASRAARAVREGWHGWDEYAPFYDWENARTVGRSDVAFWQRIARDARGPVLELGCGTGRLSAPLAADGVELVGIDRSEPMLARARRKTDRAATRRASKGARRRPGRLTLVRGDIRALPFAAGAFRLVLAPYGVLQSLVRPGDLAASLDSVARVLAPGGMFGIDLVPDVPAWREYRNLRSLRGRTADGSSLTLIESVRQDRRRRLTIFDERYVERRGRKTREQRFELVFRTIPVRAMADRLERAGFAVSAVLGDYQGRPWDERADVWIILAERV
jgi:SAM-dependent methyltransferase